KDLGLLEQGAAADRAGQGEDRIILARADRPELLRVIDEAPLARQIGVVDVDGRVRADGKDLIAEKAVAGGDGAAGPGTRAGVGGAKVGGTPLEVPVNHHLAVPPDGVDAAVVSGADALVEAGESRPVAEGIAPPERSEGRGARDLAGENIDLPEAGPWIDRGA